MIFDLNVWPAGWPWHNLGQGQSSKLHVKVHDHMMRKQELSICWDGWPWRSESQKQAV